MRGNSIGCSGTKVLRTMYKVNKNTLGVDKMVEEYAGEFANITAWGVDGVVTINGGHSVFESVLEAQRYVVEEAMARSKHWLKVAEEVEV